MSQHSIASAGSCNTHGEGGEDDLQQQRMISTFSPAATDSSQENVDNNGGLGVAPTPSALLAPSFSHQPQSSDRPRIFRPFDAAILNVVEAEYTSLMNRPATSSPTATTSTIRPVSEMYSRVMLKHRQGYPFYYPEPRHDLPLEYQTKGVRIGDVGIIKPDGAFHFLFNVDASQASFVNPSTLPADFETIPSIEIIWSHYFNPGEHLLSDNVEQTGEVPAVYQFSAPEGAVLRLLEGASIFEAREISDLRNLAARHARNWYEYASANKDISNGSLYLVTGCIKARSWEIGTSYGRPSGGNYPQFISDSHPRQGNEGVWKMNHSPTARVWSASKDEEPNQCIFGRGYKISLGEKVWERLKTAVPGSYRSASFHPRRYGFLSPDNATLSLIPEDSSGLERLCSELEGLSIFERRQEELGCALPFGSLGIASPMHPSDPIIAMLQRLELEAEVILVHDNDWCSSLPEDFAADPWNLKINDFLENVSRSCLAVIDGNGCASLVKKSTVRLTKENLYIPSELDQLCAFVEIPMELVERILNHLDLISLLKCRTVCSSFRNLVDSSPDIQWRLELAVAGKADGGNYPLSNRRKMLEQHQQGWAKFWWTHDQRLEIGGGQWELYGNLLAESNLERSQIRFRQLASQSRNIEDRVWAVDVKKGLRISDFGVDPMQDLLVIAELSGQTWADNCRIFLLTLSTGKPHPLAKKTHTLTHTTSMEQPNLRNQMPLQICGDFLATFFESHHLFEAEIVLWNWKTGEVVANIESADILAMTFLSERHVMFGVLESAMEPCLVVVDFIAEPPERRMLFEVENAATFRFPPFSDGVSVFKIEVRSDPVPNWKPHPELSAPFFSLPDNHLYFITIQLQTGGGVTWEIQVYALRDSFLPLIKSAAGRYATVIPWHMWGPEGTRMATSRSFHPDVWTRYVYGTRHVCTGVPPGLPASSIFVHDFDQLALRWNKQHENDAVRSVKGEADMSQPYEIVTAPCKIVDEEIFEGEVETKLPYRIQTWPIPGRPRVQSVMCGEDGIVIVYGAAIAEQYHVLTV